jgi:hypothetical protein
MRRPILMGLLAIGTVVGFGSGFRHMAAYRHGDCGRWGGGRWSESRYDGPQSTEQRVDALEAAAVKANVTAEQAKATAEATAAKVTEAQRAPAPVAVPAADLGAFATAQTIGQLQAQVQVQAQQLAQAQLASQLQAQQLAQAQAQLAQLSQQLVQLKMEKGEK